MRDPQRKARLAYQKLLTSGVKGPDGAHVLGTSHVEALAGLREMPLPPAAPGAEDSGDRDRVDPVAYRRERNRRKRERKARQ